jgi:selenide, water dikinase
MLRASGVAAEINAAKVPVLAGAPELAADGCIPGGTRRNMEDLAADILWDESLTDLQRLLLCDAQTSGGLLIAVPAARAEKLLAELTAEATPVAAVIGRIVEGPAGRISVQA